MSNQPSLFELFGNVSSGKSELEKKKRGRPKKNIQSSEPEQKPTKRRTKKKEIESATTKTKTKTSKANIQKPESDWIDYYNTQRPDDNVPCEFYVQMGRKKSPVFHGYVQNGYILILDDPYHGVAMRKKFNNLFYRTLCKDLSGCPNGFPNCKGCKNHKRK